MTRHLNQTRHAWKHRLLVALGALALASTGVGAVEADQSDRYTWSAELVELDDAARMVTVKSMVVGSEMKNWSDFSQGDRVILTWSGITSATGVRYISHEKANLENARLTMPVEFVSHENDGRYVTFRVAIPAGDLSGIKALEPGDWVTATVPSERSPEGIDVASIRPYTMVG